MFYQHSVRSKTLWRYVTLSIYTFVITFIRICRHRWFFTCC